MVLKQQFWGVLVSIGSKTIKYRIRVFFLGVAENKNDWECERKTERQKINWVGFGFGIVLFVFQNLFLSFWK